MSKEIKKPGPGLREHIDPEEDMKMMEIALQNPLYSDDPEIRKKALDEYFKEIKEVFGIKDEEE